MRPSPLNVSISTNNYNNYQIACNAGSDTAFGYYGGVSQIEITWDWQSSKYCSRYIIWR